MGLFGRKKKKDALVSGMSFSFIVKPQLPENVKGDLFERLINQSGMLNYFSEPRLLYGHEDRQFILIIRFLENTFSKPIDDPVYKEFHQNYRSFVIEQFEDTDYSCELLEAGVMVKVEHDLTEVVYLDKDGNHILDTGKQLNTFKDHLADSQEKGNKRSSDLNKGNELSNQGKYEEALRCFDNVLETEPDDPTALTYKGIALADLGREKESMEIFNNLLEIAPNDHALLNNKAQALTRFGKLDEAIELYDKSLEINPSYDKAYFNKGLIFQGQKKFDESIQLFDKAIEINPNYEKALILKNFAEIRKKLSLSPPSSNVDLEITCPFCEQIAKIIQLTPYELDEKNPVDQTAYENTDDLVFNGMNRAQYDAFKEIMPKDGIKAFPMIAKIEDHNDSSNKICLNSNRVYKVFWYYFINHDDKIAGITFRIGQEIPMD